MADQYNGRVLVLDSTFSLCGIIRNNEHVRNSWIQPVEAVCFLPDTQQLIVGSAGSKPVCVYTVRSPDHPAPTLPPFTDLTTLQPPHHPATTSPPCHHLTTLPHLKTLNPTSPLETTSVPWLHLTLHPPHYPTTTSSLCNRLYRWLNNSCSIRCKLPCCKPVTDNETTNFAM